MQCLFLGYWPHINLIIGPWDSLDPMKTQTMDNSLDEEAGSHSYFLPENWMWFRCKALVLYHLLLDLRTCQRRFNLLLHRSIHVLRKLINFTLLIHHWEETFKYEVAWSYMLPRANRLKRLQQGNVVKCSQRFLSFTANNVSETVLLWIQTKF